MDGMKQLKMIAGSTLVAIACYASGLFVLLTPLPIIFASSAKGQRAGVMTAVLATALIALLYLLLLPAGAVGEGGQRITLPLPGVGLEQFFSRAFSMIYGLGYFLALMAIGLTLALGSSRRWSLMRMGGGALLAGMAVVFAAVVVATVVLHEHVAAGVNAFLGFLIDRLMEVQGSTGSASMQLAALQDHAEEVGTFIIKLLPAILFVMMLITIVVNIMLGRRLLKRQRPFAHVKNLARFRLPDPIIWSVIVMGIVFFLDRYFLQTGVIAIVALNILIMVGVLYLIQGMAVIVFLLQGVRIPLFRVVVYGMMIFFLQMTGFLFLMVGIADVWVDFRLRRQQMFQQHHNS